MAWLGGYSRDCGAMVNEGGGCELESYVLGEESSFIVTFIRQLVTQGYKALWVPQGSSGT